MKASKFQFKWIPRYSNTLKTKELYLKSDIISLNLKEDKPPQME